MDAKKEIKVLDVDFIISDIKNRIEHNQEMIENIRSSIVNAHLSPSQYSGDHIQLATKSLIEGIAANSAYKRMLNLLECIGLEYVMNENGNPCFDAKEILFQKSL